MAETLLGSAVYIQRAMFIQEITSLDEVFDVLDGWPEQKRDLAYDTLCRACRDAARGRFPIAAITENFRRFAKKAGVLIEIDHVHPVGQPMGHRNLGNAS